MWSWPQSHKSNVGATQFNIRGDGCAKSSFKIESQQLCLAEHAPAAEQLKVKGELTLSTECTCHKSFVGLNSVNGELRLAERLRNLETSAGNLETDNTSLLPDEEDGEDNVLDLNSLLSTLQKCSNNQLSLYQITSIARLARSYRGIDSLTKDQASNLQALLGCDSSPVQAAALIILSKLVVLPQTLEFLFKQSCSVLDCLLNLASDPKSNEVQVLALKCIAQISKHLKLMMFWEQQLEDIVYPLVLSLIKGSNSSESLKLTCLEILQNISQLPEFYARIKQDVLSLLNQNQKYDHIQGVFIEILLKILETFKQKISTDVLETCLMSILTDMMTYQKCQSQCQALKLLTYLAGDDVTRSVLLNHPQTVAVCICLNKQSQCRKVIAGTCCLIEELLNTKNSSNAKQFMICVSESVTMDTNYEQLNVNRNRDVQLSFSGPKRLRCSDCQLWKHLDDLVDHLVFLVEKFGFLERHEQLTCELSKFGNINCDQLTIIAALIGCFNQLCVWPLNRPKSQQNQSFVYINDEIILKEDMRHQLKHLSHKHVFFVWEKVGPQVMALFKHFASRCNLWSTKSQDQLPAHSTNTTDLNSSSAVPVGTQETNVVKLLLNFILFVTVTSGYLPSTEQPEKQAFSSQTELKGKKKLQEKLTQKEMLAEKKLLRRQLIEEGLFYVMSQTLLVDDIHFKIMSTTIIRLCLQASDDKSRTSPTKHRQRAISADVQRPKSAILNTRTDYNTDLKPLATDMLNIKQRPHSSYVVQSKGRVASSDYMKRETTVLDSKKYSLFSPLTPRTEKKPIHQKITVSQARGIVSETTDELTGRISSFTFGQQNSKLSGIRDFDKDALAYLTSPLEAGSDIIPQCCERILRSSAADVLKGIFSLDPEFKKISLFLLMDLVKNGQNYLHMELSKLGCIPKLVRFLRINENDRLLEITGLSITQLLLASDRRICQLFNFHGGSHLLMALLQSKPPEDVKDAIVSTLNTLNYMVHTNQSSDKSHGPVDIWGHIMQRWKEEDKVVDVLKQFL
ncbi:CAunnamed protein product [Biomphalaria glabrata]|nr:CAunnamed protein product [Biomphalaria glabrata]